MVKPSIFSRDYENRMRKRKRRRILLFLVVIFIALGAWFSSKINIKNVISIGRISFFNKNKNNKKEGKQNILTTDNSMNEKNKDVEKKETKKEEGYDFSLIDGKNLKVIYELNGNDKKFKYIHPLESNVIYDISPSGKLITIYDSKSQKIYYMNIEGKVFDITKPNYISTNGKFSISREEQLKINASYIWCASPKFIDENTITYVSQLPWFNKDVKYVWIIDLKDTSHKNIQSIEGKNIKLERLNELGLGIMVDEQKVTLKPNGEIIK